MFENILGSLGKKIENVSNKSIPPKEKELILIVNEVLNDSTSEIDKCKSGMSYIVTHQNKNISFLIDGNKLRFFTFKNGNRNIIDATLKNETEDLILKNIRAEIDRRFHDKLDSLNNQVETVVDELKGLFESTKSPKIPIESIMQSHLSS